MMELNLITKKELDLALAEQKSNTYKRHKRLGEILLKNNYISEKDIVKALEYQLNIDIVTLEDYTINPKVVKIIPKRIAKDNFVVPIKKKNNKLTVAMADPLDVLTIDDIKFRTGCQIAVRLATKEGILDFLEKNYEKDKVIEDILIRLIDKKVSREDIYEEFKLLEPKEIKKKIFQGAINQEADLLIKDIIKHSINLKADSIHIESTADKIKIKYKIWNKLYEKVILPKSISNILVYYLKFLCKLEGIKNNKPINGSFNYKLGKNNLNLQAYFLPIVNGEKIVLKFVDGEKDIIDLTELGFLDKQFNKIETILADNSGLIILSGEKNSGKTTTMYSILNSLEKKNIITIEENVKSRLDDINQVETAKDKDLVDTLYSILDQDPDVIAVDGTFKLDKYSAKVLLDSSLAGKLVFITLEAGNVFESLTKIIEIFDDSLILASSLTAILNQKLIRQICPYCKSEDSEEFKHRLKEKIDLSELNIYSGKGCIKCKKTGYHDKIGIYQILLNDAKLRKNIYKRTDIEDIKSAVAELDFNSYQESALKKLQEEKTDIKELIRNKIMKTEWIK